MKLPFIFIHNDLVGDRESLKKIFDEMPGVYTWRFDIANCFYIISTVSAKTLYEQFVERNGAKGRFMFAALDNDRYGLMLPETWYLLRHGTHRPKED